MKKTYLIIVAILLSLPLGISAFASGDVTEIVPSDCVLFAEFKLENYEKFLHDVMPRLLPIERVEQKIIRLSMASEQITGIDITNPKAFMQESGIDFRKNLGFAITDFYYTKRDNGLTYALFIPLKDKEKFQKVFKKTLSNITNLKKLRYNLLTYKKQLIYSIEYYHIKNRHFYGDYQEHSKVYCEPPPDCNYEKKIDKIDKVDKIEAFKPSEVMEFKKVPEVYYDDQSKQEKIGQEVTYDFYEKLSFMYIGNYLVISNHSQGLKSVIDTRMYKTSLSRLPNYKVATKFNANSIINGYLNVDLLDIYPSSIDDKRGGIVFSFDGNRDKLEMKSVVKMSKSSTVYKLIANACDYDKNKLDLTNYLPSKKINFYCNVNFNVPKLISSLPYYQSIYVFGLASFWLSMCKGDSYGDYYRNKKREHDIQEPQQLGELVYNEYAKRTGISYLAFFKMLKNLGSNCSTVLFSPQNEVYDRFTYANDMDFISWIEIKNVGYTYTLIQEIISAIELDVKQNIVVEELLLYDNYFYKLRLNKSHKRRFYVFVGVYKKHLIIASQKETLLQLIKNVETDNQNYTLGESIQFSPASPCSFYMDMDVIRYFTGEPQLLPTYNYFYGYLTVKNGAITSNVELTFK